MNKLFSNFLNNFGIFKNPLLSCVQTNIHNSMFLKFFKHNKNDFLTRFDQDLTGLQSHIEDGIKLCDFVQRINHIFRDQFHKNIYRHNLRRGSVLFI